MEITKEKFKAYEDLREGGKVNMCNPRMVSNIIGLEREEVLYIMKNYTKFKDNFKYEVIEEEEIICPRCKGEMRIRDYQEDNDSEDGKMPCPTCEGNGKIMEGDEL